MLSSAQSDSNNLREWKVEFSDGRLVNIKGNTDICEPEACGEYYVMNGYSGDALNSTSSFATLAVKKNAGTVMGYGNSNPEIKGEGVVRVLFWSGNKGELSKDCVDSKDWSDGNKCKGTWKMTRDESKNGGRKRTGKGWYIIGFIWDEKTQYFGFINETNLFSKVLSGELVKGGITIDKDNPKNTGLFGSTFKGLLDTPVGSVSCLHLSSSDSSLIRGTCSSWTAWAGTITMPMGYVGTTNGNFGNKKLSEAALVIVPVDQIRVKDGKLRIGSKYEWSVEFSDGRFVKIEAGSNTGDPNCVGNTCGEYFALNGFEVDKLDEGASFATLGVKKKIENFKGYGNNAPEIKGNGAVNILFCSTVKSGLNSGSVKNETWGTNVCPRGWVIPRDGRPNGKAIKNGRSNARNGLGWYIIGFIWDKDTQYFGFIKEENLIGKVLNKELTGKGVEVNAGEPKKTELFAENFKGVLDKPIGKVGCLHVSSNNWSTLSSNCSGWDNWKDVITIPMGYVGSTKIAGKKLN